jgi:peroxiredoxin family protein
VANQELFSRINENRTLYSRLKSFAVSSLKNRQVCACETAMRIMGYSLHESSDAVKFLNVAQRVCFSNKIINIEKFLGSTKTSIFKIW